jgi:hypothetical protein
VQTFCKALPLKRVSLATWQVRYEENDRVPGIAFTEVVDLVNVCRVFKERPLIAGESHFWTLREKYPISCDAADVV